MRGRRENKMKAEFETIDELRKQHGVYKENFFVRFLRKIGIMKQPKLIENMANDIRKEIEIELKSPNNPQ